MSEEDLVVRGEVPAAERPAISLHLLVKNGESVVGRLLDCVGPYITEVVAVLDDCADGTGPVLVAKAAEHGLRRCELVEVAPRTHPELYLVDVPETYRVGHSLCGEELPSPHTGRPFLADFAAARNLGWDRCLGQWRLFLDADDVVDDPACLPGLCLALGEQGMEAAASRYYTPESWSRAEPGSSAARAASREGLGTLPGFPSQSRAEPGSSAARAASREGLGTLPGFPSQSRAEPGSSAARAASREGLGTLPGFPSQSRAEPGSSAARAASREGLRPGGLGTRPGFPSQSGGVRERLALNLSSIRWDGLVHERLVGTTIGRAAHLEGSLVVRDLRDSRGAGTRAPGRNLKILYHSARSRRWEISPREMAYLAAEARSAMPSLAARVAECCYDNSTWDEERAWAAATRAGVAEDAGELHLARGWHRRSLLAYATPAAALRLARASFAVGSWRDVVDHWRMAANLEGALQLIDAGEVDEVEVAGMAARSLLAYGRHDEVEDMCRKILSRYPGAAVPAEILRGIEASGKERG